MLVHHPGVKEVNPDPSLSYFVARDSDVDVVRGEDALGKLLDKIDWHGGMKQSEPAEHNLL